MKYLTFFIVLFTISINLLAQNELQILKSQLINEAIINGNETRWTFNKNDTLRIRILSSNKYHSKKLKQNVSEFEIEFETYTNEKYNWKSAIGKLNVTTPEKSQLYIEVKSLKTYILTELQYHDIKLSEKLWKTFTEALFKYDQDNVINCFHFPLETYGSFISDKNQLKRNFGGYFNRIKSLINSSSYLSLPEIEVNIQSSGECIFTATQINEGDEENPQITITLKARKVDGHYLFYSLEFGS